MEVELRLVDELELIAFESARERCDSKATISATVTNSSRRIAQDNVSWLVPAWTFSA